jgi:DNA-binding transcriptional LysR family regulator
MNIDWSLIRTFRSVVDTGTVAAAAVQLQCSQPTVSRHLRQLEQQTGLDLFDRRGHRMILTSAGASILDFANEMAVQADQMALAIAGKETQIKGVVRISASEVMAHYFLPPILADLKNKFPEIELELVVQNSVSNLTTREADIALRLFRPTQVGLVRRKVGNLKIGAFASESYLDRHSAPHTLGDLLAHQLVGYDQSTEILDGFRSLLPGADASLFPTRCDNHLVYWQLVKAGMGIGFGSLIVAKQEPKMRRVLADQQFAANEVWLTTHEALRNTPRIRTVWTFLSERLSETLGSG